MIRALFIVLATVISLDVWASVGKLTSNGDYDLWRAVYPPSGSYIPSAPHAIGLFTTSNHFAMVKYSNRDGRTITLYRSKNAEHCGGFISEPAVDEAGRVISQQRVIKAINIFGITLTLTYDDSEHDFMIVQCGYRPQDKAIEEMLVVVHPQGDDNVTDLDCFRSGLQTCSSRNAKQFMLDDCADVYRVMERADKMDTSPIADNLFQLTYEDKHKQREDKAAQRERLDERLKQAADQLRADQLRAEEERLRQAAGLEKTKQQRLQQQKRDEEARREQSSSGSAGGTRLQLNNTPVPSPNFGSSSTSKGSQSTATAAQSESSQTGDA